TPFSPRNVALGAGVLVLLLLVVPAIIRGGKTTDNAALAKAQLELDRLKGEIEQKKVDVERQKFLEADTRRQLEELAAKFRALEERMRDDHRRALDAISDQKQRAEMTAKFEAEQRRLEQERREQEKTAQRLLEEQKARLDARQRELDEAERA